MDSQQFKEFGKAAVDFIAEFNDTVRDRDVLPPVEPGYLVSLLPEHAPEEPQDWQSVFNEFKDTIVPGLAGWQSPQFHGFYPGGSSYPSAVGSLLTDGIGNICLTWASGPVCTELEVVTLNWLGNMIGLPEEFLNSSMGPGGGVIHSSASEAVFVCLLAAKDKTLRRMKSEPNFDEDQAKLKLVAYTSDQCNSAIEKAGLLGSTKMRLLKSSPDGRLHGETLKKAIKEDKELGLIPCYVVATLGTTGTCAFDPLDELGPICQEEGIWLHVDAAYAGAGFVCPEYQYLMNGIDYADSFSFNAHKWLLTHIACSPTWVKNGRDFINAFDIKRIYLEEVDSEGPIPDYRHWQLPLGRRFRALKLWLVLKIYGAKGLREHIRNHVSLAQYFAQLVRTDNRFVVDPQPSMGLVCIRLVDGDHLTQKLLDNLIATRKIFMVPAFSNSKMIIRVPITSRLTNKSDVELSWNLIKTEADILFGSKKDV